MKQHNRMSIVFSVFDRIETLQQPYDVKLRDVLHQQTLTTTLIIIVQRIFSRYILTVYKISILLPDLCDRLSCVEEK